MAPSVEESVTPPVLSAGDEAKRLGNEAFVAKNFDLALKHYTDAIGFDPENAVYYSNRSACYASKQLWKESMIDAEVAIIKDKSFIKAYYRLSVAQLELGMYEDAIQTLHAGLAKEPDNELLAKQVKTVRNKRTIAAQAKGQVKKQLSETQKKELMALQEQTNTYTRDLKGVQMKITTIQRETRMTQATRTQIEQLPPAIPLYRAVGKAFLLSSNAAVKQSLDAEQVTNTKAIKDLMDRQEYLERRIVSNNNNLKEMAGY